MIKNVVYLHGFRSHPASNKGRVMARAFAGEYRFIAPDLNASPEAVQTILLRAVAGLNPKETVLVGSSLGGFYAHWLSERCAMRAVLLNPSTQPWSVTQKYLGVQPITGTDRTIEVKAEFAQQLKAIACENRHPNRLLVMLCTGDTVLDWRLAHQKYSESEQVVIEGNTHEIVDFEQRIDRLRQFFCQGESA